MVFTCMKDVYAAYSQKLITQAEFEYYVDYFDCPF